MCSCIVQNSYYTFNISHQLHLPIINSTFMFLSCRFVGTQVFMYMYVLYVCMYNVNMRLVCTYVYKCMYVCMYVCTVMYVCMYRRSLRNPALPYIHPRRACIAHRFRVCQTWRQRGCSARATPYIHFPPSVQQIMHCISCSGRSRVST